MRGNCCSLQLLLSSAWFARGALQGALLACRRAPRRKGRTVRTWRWPPCRACGVYPGLPLTLPKWSDSQWCAILSRAAPPASSAYLVQGGGDSWTGVQARSVEVRRLVAALQLGGVAKPSSGNAGAPVVRLSLADVSAALLSLSTLGGDVLFEAEMEALVQVRRAPRPTPPAQRRRAQLLRQQGRARHAHTDTVPHNLGPGASGDCFAVHTSRFWARAHDIS